MKRKRFVNLFEEVYSRPCLLPLCSQEHLGRLLDLGKFSLSLKPIVQVVSIISSTLLVELISTRTNLVLQFTATVRLLEVCLDRHRGDYLGRYHFDFLL